MNSNEFARACKTFACDSAVRITVENMKQAPGRSPSRGLAALSSWFNALSEEHKGRVREVAQYAAETAVFEVLSILDGVKVVDDAHSTFELRQRANDGETIVNDPTEPYLHDLFQELCDWNSIPI